MTQLTFMDIDHSWKIYMMDADYGDTTPTIAEFEGEIFEA